jgi:hypothetical protein
VDEVVAHIRAAAACPGRIKGNEKVCLKFSYHTLLPQMMTTLERVMESPSSSLAPATASETQPRKELGVRVIGDKVQ